MIYVYRFITFMALWFVACFIGENMLTKYSIPIIMLFGYISVMIIDFINDIINPLFVVKKVNETE